MVKTTSEIPVRSPTFSLIRAQASQYASYNRHPTVLVAELADSVPLRFERFRQLSHSFRLKTREDVETYYSHPTSQLADM